MQDRIRSQVHYYFSAENLCGDMFLRGHMDGEGWVPIALLTSFKRLRKLKTNPDLVTEVCVPASACLRGSAVAATRHCLAAPASPYP